MGKKNKKKRNERNNELQRQHNRRRNEKLKNKEYINYLNNFPKLKDKNLKFIWNVECIKCKKILYPIHTISKEEEIPNGFIYGFEYDDYNIGIAPADFNKCGDYDKTNVEWTCFDCK